TTPDFSRIAPAARIGESTLRRAGESGRRPTSRNDVMDTFGANGRAEPRPAEYRGRLRTTVLASASKQDPASLQRLRLDRKVLALLRQQPLVVSGHVVAADTDARELLVGQNELRRGISPDLLEHFREALAAKDQHTALPCELDVHVD